MTIAQLPVMEIGFLGPFTRYLGNTCYRLPFFLRFLNLLQHDFSYIRMFMQIIIDILLDEIPYKLVYADSRQWIRVTVRILLWCHGKRSQLYLGLTLERRFNHIDGNCGNQTIADILVFQVFPVKLLDGTGYMFLKGTLMGTSLSSMLSIDK